MRINLGSGTPEYQHLGPHNGWITLDNDPACRPSVVADALHLPFADESLRECYAGHLIEHLPFGRHVDALREWHRALKPNGILAVTVPDFRACVEAYLDGSWSLQHLNEYIIYSTVQESEHRACLDGPVLTRTLEAAGFVDIEECDRWKDPRLFSHVFWQTIYQARKPDARAKPPRTRKAAKNRPALTGAPRTESILRTRIHQLEADLDTMHRLVQGYAETESLQGRLLELESANADLNGVNAELDRANADLQRELATADLNGANAELDRANADLQRELAARDRSIEQLQTEAQGRNSDIARLLAEARGRVGEIERLQTEKQEDVRRLGRSIAALEGVLDEKGRHIAGLEATLQHLEQVLQARWDSRVERLVRRTVGRLRA